MPPETGFAPPNSNEGEPTVDVPAEASSSSPDSAQESSEFQSSLSTQEHRPWYKFWSRNQQNQEQTDSDQGELSVPEFKDLKDTIADLEQALAEAKKLVTASERSNRVTNYQEILEQGPRNVEELIDLVNQASFEEIRIEQKKRKFGEGAIDKFKEFLAGEEDFTINEQGNIQRDSWNTLKEAGRKTLMTVFNRRTAAAGGMTAILGLLTGGVGWAAGGVIFGSMAGRGLAETIDSFRGKERDSRIKVAQAERAHWYELKDLSAQLAETDDPEKKFQLMQEITDIYHKQGESAIIQQLNLTQTNAAHEKEALNKMRSRLQTVGEIVGAGVGVTHGLLAGRTEAVDIDLFNKIKDQKVAHELIRVGSKWHFAADTASNTAQSLLAQNISGSAATTLHTLGEPAWKIGAALAVERALPVLMSSFAANYFGNKAEKQGQEKAEKFAGQITESQKEYQAEAKKADEEKAKQKEEYLNDLVRERGLDKIPAGPSDLPQGWEDNLGKLAAKHFAIDETGHPTKEGLPIWQQVDQSGTAVIENGARHLARVLSSDPKNNTITILRQYSRLLKNNQEVTWWQKDTIGLDAFIKNYSQTLLAEKGISEVATKTQEQPKEGRAIIGGVASQKSPQEGQPVKAPEKQGEQAAQIESELKGQTIQVAFKKEGNKIKAQDYQHNQMNLKVSIDGKPFYKELKQRSETEFTASVIVDRIETDPQGKIVLKVKKA